MTHNNLDYVLRARTLRVMRVADFTCDLIMIKVALLVFVTLVYLGTAGIRALGWWQEIGCSAWSLLALYVESIGVGWDTDLFALCVAMTPALALVVATRTARGMR